VRVNLEWVCECEISVETKKMNGELRSLRVTPYVKVQEEIVRFCGGRVLGSDTVVVKQNQN